MRLLFITLTLCPVLSLSSMQQSLLAVPSSNTSFKRAKQIFSAVEKCSFDEVQDLIKSKKCDPNVRHPDTGMPLIHTVVSLKNIPCLQLLLSSGVNSNATDNVGKTALFCAVQCNSLECVGLLLQHGADVSLKSRQQYTALEELCANNQTLNQKQVAIATLLMKKALCQNGYEHDEHQAFAFTLPPSPDQSCSN